MCNVIITSRKTDIILLPTEMNRMVLKKEGKKKYCGGMQWDAVNRARW